MLYERIIIYISPQFLQQQSTPDCQLEEIFNGKKGAVLHLENPEAIWTLADGLEQELEGNAYGRVILSNGLLLRLLIALARRMQNPDAAFAKPIVPTNSRILDILHYIDAHLTEDIPIERLAEEFFISKYHMMRLFRQETGYSIHGYLQERRLLHARELIRQGISATESCFRSGFGSYSSFTRAYAKRFGTTPTGRKGAPAEETYE